MTQSRFVAEPIPHYEAIVDGQAGDLYPQEVIELLLSYLERKADENRSVA